MGLCNAGLKIIDELEASDERVKKLWDNATYLQTKFTEGGYCNWMEARILFFRSQKGMSSRKARKPLDLNRLCLGICRLRTERFIVVRQIPAFENSLEHRWRGRKVKHTEKITVSEFFYLNRPNKALCRCLHVLIMFIFTYEMSIYKIISSNL